MRIHKIFSFPGFIIFLFPFSLYFLLAFLHINADPHAIPFAESHQWYDIPRNENIIIHLAKDWSRYSFLDVAYYKHPPLFFYLGALAFRVGDQAALLLLMALITACGVVTAYHFIKKLYGRETALLTAVLLSFAPGLLDASFHVMFDTGTLFFYALCSLLLYQSVVKDSWFFALGAGVSGGLAILFKTVLGLVYPGCGLFLLILYFRKSLSTDAFRAALSKVTLAFLISVVMYYPWIFYQKVNHGGYAWDQEFLYQMPWLQGAVVPPWHAYFSLTLSRWGYLFCGFIILGLVKFVRNFKESPKREDIFFFSMSIVFLAFFTVWTIKAFRFLLPVFPFFIYLGVLGIREFARWFVRKARFPEHFSERLTVFFMIIVVAVWGTKNWFVVAGVPQESPYAMAAEYIKKTGLSSDCYFTDDKAVFANSLKECVLWGGDNPDYNLQAVIGYNIAFAVIEPFSKKFAPVLDEPVKTFTANDKTVGIYPVDARKIESVKNNGNPLKVKVVDQDSRPVAGAFVRLYAAREAIAMAKTNKDGIATVLAFNEKHLMLRVESWGKSPLTLAVNPENGDLLTVRMMAGRFAVNGISISTF